MKIRKAGGNIPLPSERQGDIPLSLPCVALVAAVTLIAFARPAYAYVDPSVMTYTIQALAAVTVALSAVAGVAFRRSRRVILRALGIDEDANKIAEPDVSPIEPDRKASADAAFIQAGTAPKKTKKKQKKLGWLSRLWRALLASEALAFTLLIVAPLELVAGNQKWLLFGLSEVTAPVVVAGLVAGLVLAVILSLFRGRAFSVVLCLTGALTFCCYLQALLLNGPLPVADGASVDWDKFRAITIVSAVVWVLILLLFALLGAKFQRATRFVVLAGCTALAVIQGVGLWSLWNMPVERVETPIMITQEGLFDVSRKNNVVVFVLDACDTRWVDAAVKEDPSMPDSFTGFTYYIDTVGGMSPTRYAIPSLLTAQQPTPADRVAEDYITRRYSDGRFLDDLDDTGCDIGVYSENAAYFDNEREMLAEHVDNIHRDEGARSLFFDPKGAVKILWKSALYRDSPWVFKPRFWYSGDQLNIRMLDASRMDRFGAERRPYIIDDVNYYTAMTGNPLEYNDNENGSFRFIHLMGSHYPWDMTRDVRRVEAGGSTVVDQTIGAFKIVSTYLEQLKAIGAYEDTTVIVTADHGKLYTDLEELSEVTNAIMLFKPGNQTPEEAAAPLTISWAPVSHRDFQPTVLDQLGASEQVVASYDGEPIYEVSADAIRTRYYYMASYNSTGSADRFLMEYEIDGNAHDFVNWNATGNVWIFENERSGFSN